MEVLQHNGTYYFKATEGYGDTPDGGGRSPRLTTTTLFSRRYLTLTNTHTANGGSTEIRRATDSLAVLVA